MLYICSRKSKQKKYNANSSWFYRIIGSQVDSSNERDSNFKRQHFDGRLKRGLVSVGVWVTIQYLVRQLKHLNRFQQVVMYLSTYESVCFSSGAIKRQYDITRFNYKTAQVICPPNLKHKIFKN